ncbi:MAG: hypothetical protein HFACDABA_00826 [Anaerolineales bacterium]|nr:hypothetical protein [Anaerolineales bacterium]
MRIKPTPILTLFLILTLLLGSCGPQETPAPTPTIIPSPTITPTATPSVPLVILVVPADMDPALSNLYQSTVYDLAQSVGYHFQVRNSLTPADLDPSLKVVVALPPDPGIIALAAAAPQVQFLAVDLPGVTAAGNISVVATQARPDLVGFLFGYIAAMLTPDWGYSLGMIAPQGDPNAQMAFAAYKNGMTYYCNLCPKANPYAFLDEFGQVIEYPQYIEIPTDEAVSSYTAYADFLYRRKKVSMIYVYPTAATPDLLGYIGSLGLLSITDTTPEPRPVYYVASLRPDLAKAIQLAWADLLAGRASITYQPPFSLIDVDTNLLTPGKQQQVEQILAELLAGRIAPLSP